MVVFIKYLKHLWQTLGIRIFIAPLGFLFVFFVLVGGVYDVSDWVVSTLFKYDANVEYNIEVDPIIINQ